MFLMKQIENAAGMSVIFSGVRNRTWRDLVPEIIELIDRKRREKWSKNAENMRVHKKNKKEMKQVQGEIDSQVSVNIQEN